MAKYLPFSLTVAILVSACTHLGTTPPQAIKSRHEALVQCFANASCNSAGCDTSCFRNFCSTFGGSCPPASLDDASYFKAISWQRYFFDNLQKYYTLNTVETKDTKAVLGYRFSGANRRVDAISLPRELTLCLRKDDGRWVYVDSCN